MKAADTELRDPKHDNSDARQAIANAPLQTQDANQEDVDATDDQNSPTVTKSKDTPDVQLSEAKRSSEQLTIVEGGNDAHENAKPHDQGYPDAGTPPRAVLTTKEEDKYYKVEQGYMQLFVSNYYRTNLFRMQESKWQDLP